VDEGESSKGGGANGVAVGGGVVVRADGVGNIHGGRGGAYSGESECGGSGLLGDREGGGGEREQEEAARKLVWESERGGAERGRRDGTVSALSHTHAHTHTNTPPSSGSKVGTPSSKQTYMSAEEPNVQHQSLIFSAPSKTTPHPTPPCTLDSSLPLSPPLAGSAVPLLVAPRQLFAAKCVGGGGGGGVDGWDIDGLMQDDIEILLQVIVWSVFVVCVFTARVFET